jgi:hypothetical protein
VSEHIFEHHEEEGKMKKFAFLALVAIVPISSANLFEHSLDGSDMTGINSYWHTVTGDYDNDTNPDGYITQYDMKDWWAIGIDLAALGVAPLDVSNLSPTDTISFEARFFQAESNTDRWGDAPIGFQMRTVGQTDPEVLDWRAKWEWPFGPQGDAETYPDWTMASTTFGEMAPDPWFWSEEGGWDPTNVVELVFYGTNWDAGDPSEDFVQIRNLVITPEPTSLAMLGGLMLLVIRRR